MEEITKRDPNQRRKDNSTYYMRHKERLKAQREEKKLEGGQQSSYVKTTFECVICKAHKRKAEKAAPSKHRTIYRQRKRTI